VNLRGKVIPIVDLRRRFDMPDHEGEIVIIVVSVHGKQVGIAVDRVSEVLLIGAAEIEPAPDLGSTVDADFLLGIARAEGRVRLLLDIERVLRADDVTPIAA
jgi:purine-binding chemotaxis protein CheW